MPAWKCSYSFLLFRFSCFSTTSPLRALNHSNACYLSEQCVISLAKGSLPSNPSDQFWWKSSLNRVFDILLEFGWPSNMQVKFSLNVALKSWDLAIYENVRQISLTKNVSDIWLVLYCIYGSFLYCSIIGVENVPSSKKKSDIRHHLSERNSYYIFINGRIGALQSNLQTKFNLHIWWPSRLQKYIKALWNTLYKKMKIQLF